MLTAEGPINKTPPATFTMASAENAQPQPARLADATARLFWGIQLRCAECHDHPFAHWKQTDFWATAAFFSRTRHTGFKGGGKASITETPESGKPAPGPEIAIPTTGGKRAGNV